VKPAAFRYQRPLRLADAVALLEGDAPDAKPLAGGQSLVALMNLRLARPGLLVDLDGIDALRGVELVAGGVRIGAMTTHRQVQTDPLITEQCPLLARAVSFVGYPAIRIRGTLGGSIAHADPAAEMPLVALAADASMLVVGRASERRVHADEFFVDFFTTCLEPAELLVAVEFPARRVGDGFGFHELSRKSGDFALVAAACCLRLRGGVVDQARVALAGVSRRPLRARACEQRLVGAAATPGLLEEASGLAAALVDVADDQAGGRRYRQELAVVLTRRALADALEEATRSSKH
jgi:aerobic carbon-monoxide dehydrogenase medium subunit